MLLITSRKESYLYLKSIFFSLSALATIFGINILLLLPKINDRIRDGISKVIQRGTFLL